MMKRTLFSLMFVSVAIAGVAGGNDFEHLRAHWNFDEGRDWHNMPFPYKTPANKAYDYVNGNDITLKGIGAKWISGRQYSGITAESGLSAEKAIRELQGTCSLSYWVRCPKKSVELPEGIIGSDKGLAWGVIARDGKVGISLAGKSMAETTVPVNDGDWHHVVITRNAENGEVQIFLDGKPAATGKAAVRADEKAYDTFCAAGIELDQIHVFDTVVSPATVAVLYDNHAPKAYPQTFLVDRKQPTVTGSVLHGFTYDPELDKLSVHTSQKSKSWVSNGDGTFTYTPPKNFKGETKVYATVTDGRGGFCRIPVTLRDSRRIVGLPVKEFTYVGELAAFPDTGEKAGQHRNPIVVDLGGKLPQLIVQANNRLWFCRNQSKRGKISFAKPEEILDKSKQPVKTDGAAVLEGNRLLVRNSDGSMQYATLRGKGKPTLVFGGDVKDTQGKPFKCNSRHFIVIDYDNDDIPDIITGESAGLYFYKGQARKGAGKGKKGIHQRISFAAEGKIIHGRQYNIAPAMGDLNGDDRPELVYGINWGTTHAWINDPDKENICKGSAFELQLLDAPKENLIRDFNGAHCAIADFDGDGSPDILFGDNKNGGLISAKGVGLDVYADNLQIIEKEFYDGNTTKVGRKLEENDRAGMKRYKELMVNWIRWAMSTNTPAKRQKAFDMLVEHCKKYDFLQRTTLKEAWVKTDKQTNKTTYGDMHHVPGIFTQNWMVLDQLLPDSEAKLKAVADALGLKGTDREQYLATGMPLADNNRCSDGQLNAIRDLLSYHPHILFPDDHISIGVMFGDGRDAMCYIFKSNKNTFQDEVGSCIAEMHGDMVRLAEECLGGKGAAGGDYFTFVLAHEVCHSLDGYVHSRINRDLHRRWGDMMVYAATNAGETDHVVAGENGWWNHNLTKKRFKERKLWDGDNATWDATWKQYWKDCPFRNKVFMRGDVDWFLGAMQETLATQANHHWARSEARLIGAILRYLQGYKSNINEAVLYLDILSAGMNKIPMYHPYGLKNPPRVQFDIDYAWLVRNDQGYITDVHIGDRHYAFEVNEKGRVVGVKSYPFAEQIQKAAGKK